MRLAVSEPCRDNAASVHAIASPTPSIQGSRLGRAKGVVTGRGAQHAGADALPEGQRRLLPAHRATAWRRRCERVKPVPCSERLRTGQTAAVCKASHNDHE